MTRILSMLAILLLCACTTKAEISFVRFVDLDSLGDKKLRQISFYDSEAQYLEEHLEVERPDRAGKLFFIEILADKNLQEVAHRKKLNALGHRIYHCDHIEQGDDLVSLPIYFDEENYEISIANGEREHYYYAPLFKRLADGVSSHQTTETVLAVLKNPPDELCLGMGAFGYVGGLETNFIRFQSPYNEEGVYIDR